MPKPRFRVVAESFSWPFRGDWKSRWLPGLLTVLLVPIAFIPLLGYAIAATRAAEVDDAPGPPKWAVSSGAPVRRLLDVDGPGGADRAVLAVAQPVCGAALRRTSVAPGRRAAFAFLRPRRRRVRRRVALGTSAADSHASRNGSIRALA